MNAHDKQASKRTARLFRNGRSQAVRIPKEFEFEGDEVVISKGQNGKLILEGARRKPSLLEVLAKLEPLSDEEALPEITDDDLLPLDDVEL